MTAQEFLQKDLAGTEAQIAYAKKLILREWDECKKWMQRVESMKPSSLEMYASNDCGVRDRVDAYRALLNETNASKIIEVLKKV